MKTAWRIIKETISEFSEDRVMRLSAAMAYYAIFSIGPLLVLIIGVAGLLMGEDNVRRTVTEQLQSLFGQNGQQSTKLVESMMTPRQHGHSLIATIVGGVGLLFGAAGVFGQLQDSLNTIWEVKPKPGRGIWGFIRDRFLSMSMVLGIGFLLLVSMVLTTLINGLSGWVSHIISMPPWVAQVLSLIFSLGLITVLFAVIFKVLPDVQIKWRDVWIGAFGTALLFTAGKFGLGLYLGREGTTSAYGAGAAFVLVLLYIYYSSLILFIGAEFTQVYARVTGSKIVPSKNAVPVTEEARANEGMPRDRNVQREARSRREHPEPQSAYVASQPQTTFNDMQNQPSHAHASRSAFSPGDRIQARPWSFIGLAMAAGATAGLLWRFKMLRKGLRLFLAVRRVI